MGTEVRALSPSLFTITTASFKAAVKTTDCMSAAEQHNCKARQKEVLLHSTMCSRWLCLAGLPQLAHALASGFQGPASETPCYVLLPGHWGRWPTDLHGLMALTVMSLDTHPAQCPGRPRRGPGMISSRTAETSLISQWTQLVYKWGMDAWSLRLPTRNGPKETTVPDGDHLPSNFGFAPHNNSVSYMVFLQTTVTEMQTSTSSFPRIRSHHYLLMNALPPFQLRKPHEKPHIISSLNMKCHRFFFLITTLKNLCEINAV